MGSAETTWESHFHAHTFQDKTCQKSGIFNWASKCFKKKTCLFFFFGLRNTKNDWEFSKRNKVNTDLKTWLTSRLHEWVTWWIMCFIVCSQWLPPYMYVVLFFVDKKYKKSFCEMLCMSLISCKTTEKSIDLWQQPLFN